MGFFFSRFFFEVNCGLIFCCFFLFIFLSYFLYLFISICTCLNFFHVFLILSNPKSLQTSTVFPETHSRFLATTPFCLGEDCLFRSGIFVAEFVFQRKVAQFSHRTKGAGGPKRTVHVPSVSSTSGFLSWSPARLRR